MEKTVTNIDPTSFLIGIMDDMLEGLQVIGTDWRYLYVNEVVARHGKKKREDLLGRTMMECYPGIENTPAFAQFKKVMAERESTRFENEFTFPDGTRGCFELLVHPVDQGILILSVDVTARKCAEAELKEKIKELDVLMNSTINREVRVAKLKEEINNLKLLADRHLTTV